MKDEAEMSAPMLGSVEKPEAWLVEGRDGLTFCYQDYRYADLYAADFGGEIVPLYRRRESRGGWIPAVAQLPPDGELVLWYMRGYGCAAHIHVIGSLEGDFIHGENGYQYHFGKDIYWMPLPAPPETSK